MMLLIVVALVWGVTNALMKKYVMVEKVEQKEKNFLYNLFNEFISIVRNWKYLLSFGANQTGSLLYYYALGQYDLSLAGPITNALTLAVTYFSDKFFFESNHNVFEKAGLGLICFGVLICFYDKM